MRTKSEKWLLGLGLVYVLAMPILISVILAWEEMPDLVRRAGSETAAAWLQAFGGIAAIFGAVYVGNRQASHDRALEADRRQVDRRLEADRRQLEADNAAQAFRARRVERAVAVLSVVHRAMAMVAVRRRPRGNALLLAAEGLTLRELRTTSTLAALNQIDLNTVPNPLLIYFISIRGNLDAINKTLDQVDMDPPPAIARGIEKVWRWAEDNFDNICLIAQAECGVGSADIPRADWRGWMQAFLPGDRDPMGRSGL